MDKRIVAMQLVLAAKEVVAGTWKLPDDDLDIAAVVAAVENMDDGEWPTGEHPIAGSPADVFYRLLGDDALLDDFYAAKRQFLMACAVAVRKRVEEMVDSGGIIDADDQARMALLARRLGVNTEAVPGEPRG